MPQGPVNPSQATVAWPGWTDIWKTRKRMAEEGAGEPAFVAYLDTMIRPPRRFGPSQAQRIAAMLRGAPGGAPYPYAFPIREIMLVIKSVKTGDGTSTPSSENNLGRWARERGGRVYYPTQHLDGTWSAPSSVKDNSAVIKIAAALAGIGRSADALDALTVDECAELLEPVMREQLTAMADDMIGRTQRVYELLRTGE